MGGTTKAVRLKLLLGVLQLLVGYLQRAKFGGATKSEAMCGERDLVQKEKTIGS